MAIEPQAVLNILLKYEQESGLVDRKLLCRTLGKAIQKDTLTFVIFSCLTTKRGGEELVTDFFRTLFFDGGEKGLSRSVRKTIKIIQEIEALGVKADVIPILVDTEPRRTWGWKVPQEELTLECEIMLEQAQQSDLLPKNWKPMLWSQIETQYAGEWTFESSLEWAQRPGKHAILVNQQERCLEGFANRYHFPLGSRATAIRQVAAYALEGAILKEVFPEAVLLQSEYPPREKNPLYQYHRQTDPLQIIHPFPN